MCFLKFTKCDLDDVEETVLNDFERQFEGIFYILGIQKKWFGRIHKSDILSRWMALRTDNLRSGRLKKRLLYVDNSMYLVLNLPCELILYFLVIEKIEFDEVGKVMF
jgi:hypothetical protein